MRITYSLEKFSDYWPEMKPILDRVHAPEAAMLQDKTVPILNESVFTLFETQGTLHSVIARDEEKMIGYHISVLHDNQDHMLLDQSRYVLTAQVLKYFIYKEYRGHGIGSSLFRCAENSLKSLGVELMLSEAKTKLPYAPLFHHLGWHEQAVVFSKWLGN